VLSLPAAPLTLALGLSTQAQAAASQVCGNGGTGYCLNDWGGAGAHDARLPHLGMVGRPD